jgi:hypothetical protein
MANYNKACAYARQGDARSSANALKRAAQSDKGALAQAERDHDFDLVRTSPEFQAIFGNNPNS